mgnify:CR=1 FL=1
MECHIGDGFETPETAARADLHGVGGIPHVVFDGGLSCVGGRPCEELIDVYDSLVDSCLTISGGTSPVRITGDFVVEGNQATLTARFELVDPASFTTHHATLFIYEDNIHGEWDGVVRMVRSTPVSLTEVGQIESVVETLDITGMDPAQLRPLAIYEEAGGKYVIQAGDFIPLDYELDFHNRVASVPHANGVALFTARLVNTGEPDVVHLSLDPAFDWPAGFRIEGQSGQHEEFDLPLAPGETAAITVEVMTDGDKRIGTGTFRASSRNTGRVDPVELRVFNGSPAILLVDDDNGTSYETPFTEALDHGGYLFEMIPEGTDAASLAGFDAVVWQTGYQGSTVTFLDRNALMTYLDGGGRLFLSSMDYLSGITPPSAFVAEYLGVESWTVNTRSSFAVGAPGDPITDGMDIALEWPIPNANRVDTVVPGPGASAIFLSRQGDPIAVRHERPGLFRTVFNTVCQDAFPTTGADPNNSDSVIERTLAWLLQRDPSAADHAPARPLALRVEAAPNPSRLSANIRLQIGDTPRDDGRAHQARRDLRVDVVDVGGRRVRNLLSGDLPAGVHQIAWDLMEESGRPAADGIYFVRLQSGGGVASAKLVITR